ncbi:MAG: hypothetical protein DLM53_06200 [Candidatus Eremiobacter antarcticus]|nr:hypothetical protein [Candidatus Eremiobacteraeota bacterium]MBC5807099.1 hypothetical protein [Candidatus Eremiobacteraeota bacterium]PZR62404.1 MAG: hypothetical protein DLM53_06200 [Candidatus Eremiobacter sp. RRmetagenome_bin22]
MTSPAALYTTTKARVTFRRSIDKLRKCFWTAVVAAVVAASVQPAAAAEYQLHRFVTLADFQCRVDRIRAYRILDPLFADSEDSTKGFAVVDVTFRNMHNSAAKLPTYTMSFADSDGDMFGGQYETSVLGPYEGDYPVNELKDARPLFGPHESRHVWYVVLGWPFKPLTQLILNASVGIDLDGTNVDLRLPDYTPGLLRTGRFTSIADVEVRLDSVTSVAKAGESDMLKQLKNQDKLNGYFTVAATIRNPNSARAAMPNLFPLFQVMEDGNTTRNDVNGPFEGTSFDRAPDQLNPGQTMEVTYFVSNWLYQEDVIGMTLDAVVRFPLGQGDVRTFSNPPKTH